MILAVLNFIAWFVVGIINLFYVKEISRTSYCLIWIILMLYLVLNVVSKMG